MKRIKEALVGAAIGAAAGTAIAGVRCAVAFCPPLWVVGDAVGCGTLAYYATDGKPFPTAVGAVGGAALGCMELAVAPLSSAMILLTAPLYIPVGAVTGAVVALS